MANPNIIKHPVSKTEIDTSDIVNRKISKFKEIAYSIFSDGKKEIFQSTVDFKMIGLENKDEIMTVLIEGEIIKKIANNKFQVLVKSKSEIDSNFSKITFVPDKKYHYSQKIEHKYLKDKKEINAESESQLEIKVIEQIIEWENRWYAIAPDYFLGKFQNVLYDSLNLNFAPNDILDTKAFDVPKPVRPPLFKFVKPEPLHPKGNIFGVSKKAKLEYEQAQEKWINEKNEVDEKNNELIKEHEISQAKWNDSLDDYINNQLKYNSKIEQLFSGYDEYETNESISNYFEFILNRAYDDPYKNDLKIVFEPESKILKVNLELPSISQFPTIKESIYIKTRSEFKDKYYTQKEIDSLYDDSIYKFILSSIHLILKHDFKKYVDSVNINGWVNSLNKGLYVKYSG